MFDLKISVTGAAMEKLINTAIQSSIPISEVSQINELTWEFYISRQDYPKLEALVHKFQGKLVILERKGLSWKLGRLLKRPVLIVFLVFLLFLSIFLPTRILFVAVDGNDVLPAGQILAATEDCGIRFGASRRKVRSEKVKNALLGKIPQLQWAGVNTRGCTAYVSVRERREENQTNRKPFTSLIATQDGYILSLVAMKGTPLVLPGESVTRGQTLISGYTDCGICIRVGRAEGEILAQTNREITAVTPKKRAFVREITDTNHKISLRIGKKRIKLWKDSSISHGVCGRMYAEYSVSLPGGFQLPMALCVDRYLEYRISEEEIPEDTALEQLQNFSDQYLLLQTVAGQILKKQQTLTEAGGCYELRSRYTCTEMIGREQEEQMGDIHEQRD